MRLIFKCHFFITLALLINLAVAASEPCNLRVTEYGNVCVCTADYCDYLDNPEPEDNTDFIIVSSTKNGLRFRVKKAQFEVFHKYFIQDYDTPTNNENYDNVTRATNTRNVVLQVNRDRKYQKIVGFGGSYTGSVVYLVNQLKPELQDHLFKSYYSKSGIGFTLMRMPIGGCDFDLEPWAYNELPGNDPKLSNFTDLDPRDVSRLSHIKRLIEVSGIENLRIKGAAWSPPRWMKTNNKWTGQSRLKKEYYQVWADYHLKWLELMEANGLPIWAISTGNEPMNGVSYMSLVKFMSLGWTPKLQAIWLSENLGPTIRNSQFKDLVLFGNDDQRNSWPTWFRMMNQTRPDSVSYLDGFSVHWYLDEMFSVNFIDNTYKLYPNKLYLVSESCIGDKPWHLAKPKIGSWERAEKFARDILQNFQHNFNAYIDWNIILDENGGPNYVNNTVDAPVVVIASNPEEILMQPMFYIMGHFSKFVPEGSIRIDSLRNNVNVDSIAFLRPDDTISLIVFNSGKAQVEVTINDSVRGAIDVVIPPRSMHTMIYK